MTVPASSRVLSWGRFQALPAWGLTTLTHGRGTSRQRSLYTKVSGMQACEAMRVRVGWPRRRRKLLRAHGHVQVARQSLFSFSGRSKKLILIFSPMADGHVSSKQRRARPRPSVRSLTQGGMRAPQAVSRAAACCSQPCRGRDPRRSRTRAGRRRHERHARRGFAARCPSAAPMRPRAWPRDTWRLSPRTPFILIFSPSARAYSHFRDLGRSAFAFLITGSGRCSRSVSRGPLGGRFLEITITITRR